MIQIRLLALLALCGLLAACGQQVVDYSANARAAAYSGRFAPYVANGEGWGGRTISLFTPSAGGEG